MAGSERKTDLLVVGGGPAGSLAARAAAEAGLSVLLIDAKRRFGGRPHCAEYVPRLLAREVDFPSRSVAQPVEAMETVLPGGSTLTAAPGYILDRVRFDHGLAEAAASVGAELWAGARLLSRQDHVFLIKTPGGLASVRAKAVIAADGAASTVRRLLGRPRRPLLTGVQFEVPLNEALDRTRIFFKPVWLHGYAWLFPKGPVANLGLGLLETLPGQAWKMLEDWRGEMQAAGVIGPGLLARSVGAIAVGGPDTDLTDGNIIFAGDAAGLTHPVTGAGIPQAAISGKLAGLAAAEFVRTGKTTALAEYEQEIIARYGRSLAWALDKRRLLEDGWPGGGFNALIGRTWPAFPGYRRD